MTPRRPTHRLAVVMACCALAGGSGALALPVAAAGGIAPGEKQQTGRTGAISDPGQAAIASRRSDLTVAQAAGQMVVGRLAEGATTANASIDRRIEAGALGAVILFSSNIVSSRQLRALTAELQAAARRGRRPALLIGVDQEGGLVKRVPFAAPWRSAEAIGKSPNVGSLARAEGRNTGNALRALGVNMDFAPVADVAHSRGNFIAATGRAFGSSRTVVERGATEFAEGLAEGGLIGTAKHFPGLGYAGSISTDEAAVVIRRSARSLRADYAAYEAMAAKGPRVAPVVMVSNAIYPALHDPVLPAALSEQIVRHELGRAHMAGRVVITDDLDVPEVARYGPRAVAWAVRAGDDMLMFAARETRSAQAYREIVGLVAHGALRRATVLAAAEKVVQLKREFGLRVPAAY